MRDGTVTAALSLFDPPPVQPLTDQQRKADIEAWLRTLVPIAQELAAKAGPHGVTVSDVRIAAQNRGLATGKESRTRGSYLGQLMRMAGLKKTRERRTSLVKDAHHNSNIVYVLPEYAPTEYARRSA